MKQKYLFNDIEVFRPRFKCGVGVAIAGIAAAAASVYAADVAADSQASVNATSNENFHESMNFNASEAEKTRNFQHDENQIARDWQSGQTKSQQDFTRLLIDSQRNYDSFGNQVKLAKAAGFNPSSVLSGGVSVGSGSSFAAPSIPQASSAPSSPSAVAPPLPQLGNPGAAWQNGINSISSLINSLGSFDQNTAEGSKVRKTTEGFVEMLANQVYGEQLENSFKSVQLVVSKNTALKSALADLQNKYFDGMLKQYQGQLFDRQAFLTELQQFTEIAKSKLTDAQYNDVMNGVLSFTEAFQKQMDVRDSEILANKASATASRASASASYATARNLNAQTLTEDSVRQFKVDYEKYHALIEKSTHTVLNATEQARMNEIVNRSINSGFVNELTQQQLRKAIKENDWYEVGRIMNAVGVLAGVGIALKR